MIKRYPRGTKLANFSSCQYGPRGGGQKGTELAENGVAVYIP